AENTINRAEYAATRANHDKALLEITAGRKAMARALYAVDRAIEIGGEPAPNPSPEPTPTPTPDPIDEPVDPAPPKPLVPGLRIKTADQPPIAVLTDAEYEQYTVGARIPGSMGTDPVGAFRFVGNTTFFGLFDPITRRGQDEGGHLHLFANNNAVNGHSDYEQLRRNGDGRSQGHMVNRSPEWIAPPCAVDANGVRRPWNAQRVARYYKAIPDYQYWDYLDEGFQEWRAKQSDIQIEYYKNTPLVDMPAGLQFISGYRYGFKYKHTLRKADGKTITLVNDTTGATQTVREASAYRFDKLIPFMEAGDVLSCEARSPEEWDGVHAQVEDYDSHLRHEERGRNYWNLIHHESHPVRIVGQTAKWQFVLPAGFDYTTLVLTSDLELGTDPGTTFHNGYIEAHEPRVRADWFAHAINRHLDCSEFNLGNGRMGLRGQGFTFDDPWDRYGYEGPMFV
ncbi:DUF1996 domain-containing protein, partial [Altererythrobacter sp. HHU K3-1]|nr:DUF1996 domain-containing protein [Actirhodobacter atriluteus]